MVSALDHPLVKHHLTILRDKTTSPHLFREQIGRLSRLLAYEAMADLALSTVAVDTPICSTTGFKLSDRIALIPILRAGLGMSDAVHELYPQAEVWHLGFQRDETTLQPVEYYQKFSQAPPQQAFILDPMLATGGSALAGIEQLKKWGVERISMLSILAAPEGIEQLSTRHPDVQLFTCAIDENLDEKGYIIPGLGDAGDRIFNTLL